MKQAGSDNSLRCSFCKKSQDVVGKLISAPQHDNPSRAYICEECIAVCHAIIEEDKRAESKPAQLSSVITGLAAYAQFSPPKMAKVDLARGETMFVGLNCFESGQEHSAHAHVGQDKLYVVLEGFAEIQVGDERKKVSAGGGAFAPSGVMHSIRNVGPVRLVVLAVLSPPPTVA